MLRSSQAEILDDPDYPGPLRADAYRDLTRIHRWLGNTGLILAALRDHPNPLRRVLDVGCGNGEILSQIRHRLGCEVIGVDLRLCECSGVPVVQTDAINEPLPSSDVAISLCLAHHLAEPELIALIRNVGRSSRRFIILDLVRHPLPLALFRVFVAPFVTRVTAVDGCRSIKRSYTPQELARVVTLAVGDSGATFHHTVAPLYRRQVVDIYFPPKTDLYLRNRYDNV
jgi:SAM-dependent methyltransferase